MCYSLSDMKRSCLVLSAILLFFLYACSKQDQAINWNDSELQWNSYYDGLAELKATGNKGTFIIYADWCPTCKQYSKLFKNGAVIDALQGITLIRLNKDKQPDVSKQFDFDGE